MAAVRAAQQAIKDKLLAEGGYPDSSEDEDVFMKFTSHNSEFPSAEAIPAAKSGETARFTNAL